jgi:hypothetical protein
MPQNFRTAKVKNFILLTNICGKIFDFKCVFAKNIGKKLNFESRKIKNSLNLNHKK